LRIEKPARDKLMSDFEFDLDAIDIITPDRFQQKGYPHEEWTYLRRHRPVFHVERPRIQPFWAITRSADSIEISRQPRLWINIPRIAVFMAETGEDQTQPEALPLKHLLNMDPPQHGEYRAILSRRFTPRAVRALQPQLEEICRTVLDDSMDK
jgi:cholest-4-en-3-one 26-monooxygenase